MQPADQGNSYIIVEYKRSTKKVILFTYINLFICEEYYIKIYV